MSPVRYEPNPMYVQEIEKEVDFIAGRQRITKRIAEIAQSIAPVHSGYYKAHIIGSLAAVGADDSYYHWIEFGSVHNKPKAPLRRAFRAAGLRLVMLPKHS
jgi:hypothetical protein